MLRVTWHDRPIVVVAENLDVDVDEDVDILYHVELDRALRLVLCIGYGDQVTLDGSGVAVAGSVALAAGGSC